MQRETKIAHIAELISQNPKNAKKKKLQKIQSSLISVAVC